MRTSRIQRFAFALLSALLIVLGPLPQCHAKISSESGGLFLTWTDLDIGTVFYSNRTYYSDCPGKGVFGLGESSDFDRRISVGPILALNAGCDRWDKYEPDQESSGRLRKAGVEPARWPLVLKHWPSGLGNTPLTFKLVTPAGNNRSRPISWSVQVSKDGITDSVGDRFDGTGRAKRVAATGVVGSDVGFLLDYDSAGTLASAKLDDPEHAVVIRFTRPDAHTLVMATESGKKATYTFDSYGRLTSVVNGWGNKYVYRYQGSSGYLTEADYPDASRVTATYEAQGFVSSFNEQNGCDTTVTWSTRTDGKILSSEDVKSCKGIWINTYRVEFGYDKAGEVDHQKIALYDGEVGPRVKSLKRNESGKFVQDFDRENATAYGVPLYDMHDPYYSTEIRLDKGQGLLADEPVRDQDEPNCASQAVATMLDGLLRARGYFDSGEHLSVGWIALMSRFDWFMGGVEGNDIGPKVKATGVPPAPSAVLAGATKMTDVSVSEALKGIGGEVHQWPEEPGALKHDWTSLASPNLCTTAQEPGFVADTQVWLAYWRAQRPRIAAYDDLFTDGKPEAPKTDVVADMHKAEAQERLWRHEVAAICSKAETRKVGHAENRDIEVAADGWDGDRRDGMKRTAVGWILGDMPRVEMEDLFLLNRLIDSLRAGIPAELGVCAWRFVTDQERAAGAKSEPDDASCFGHAITVAGMRASPDGRHVQFLLRNSWGKTCAPYREPYLSQCEAEAGSFWVNFEDFGHFDPNAPRESEFLYEADTLLERQPIAHTGSTGLWDFYKGPILPVNYKDATIRYAMLFGSHVDYGGGVKNMQPFGYGVAEMECHTQRKLRTLRGNFGDGFPTEAKLDLASMTVDGKEVAQDSESKSWGQYLTGFLTSIVDGNLRPFGDGTMKILTSNFEQTPAGLKVELDPDDMQFKVVMHGTTTGDQFVSNDGRVKITFKPCD